jgi:hypothetical protein
MVFIPGGTVKDYSGAVLHMLKAVSPVFAPPDRPAT